MNEIFEDDYIDFTEDAKLSEKYKLHGCAYREPYRHDGGTYYSCAKQGRNYDCFDSYTDCISNLDIKNNCKFIKSMRSNL